MDSSSISTSHPQENSLKPPQDHMVYSMNNSTTYSVQWLARSYDLDGQIDRKMDRHRLYTLKKQAKSVQCLQTDRQTDKHHSTLYFT